MIIGAENLKGLPSEFAMVAGGFDPLHEGHIAYFEAAAKFGMPLLCCVDPDEYVARKHGVLLEQAKRAQVLDALKPVSFVYLNQSTTADALRKLKPTIFVKGADWRGRLPPLEEKICAENGTRIEFVDAALNSSTGLIQRLLPANEEQVVQDFETLVQRQHMPAATTYDQEYFQGDWRTHDRYDLETRRKIEGKHPEVVKEVFAPKRVIDMGCGPGYLLHLLHEVGVEADGLDISPSSPEMATPEVRGRIRIGSIVDHTLPDEAYDLVICREVIEHLPVLDVHRAVQNMCRISSKYVYVTTRFHPAPASLLDVTTEFEVDPTHITVMNKNMLRLMFVLSGFKRREDLENRMDWMGKKRVLVYERADLA